MNKNYSVSIEIDGRIVSNDEPTYFIADIAANHDGDLELAKDLIWMAKEAGADAAKFQHFKAETIVSDFGFRSLGNKKSHQSRWGKSVYEVYEGASVSLDWTHTLKETADKAGITFFTSPYAFDLVDEVDKYVSAYKIGSGDITWIDLIAHIASKKKPTILATGASNMEDVVRAVDAILDKNDCLCLMQCNTNYTASIENFKFINLNVIKVFREMYPGMILGLSDHTPGHSTVLGAISLGARMIEKHFTDDNNRQGPDHLFSMNPNAWKEMVKNARELENALGFGIKRVEQNELETVVLQRRAVRVKDDLPVGTVLTKDCLILLRPCPLDAIPPYSIDMIVGKKIIRNLKAGEHLKWSDLS